MTPAIDTGNGIISPTFFRAMLTDSDRLNQKAIEHSSLKAVPNVDTEKTSAVTG